MEEQKGQGHQRGLVWVAKGFRVAKGSGCLSNGLTSERFHPVDSTHHPEKDEMTVPCGSTGTEPGRYGDWRLIYAGGLGGSKDAF